MSRTFKDALIPGRVSAPIAEHHAWLGGLVASRPHLIRKTAEEVELEHERLMDAEEEQERAKAKARANIKVCAWCLLVLDSPMPEFQGVKVTKEWLAAQGAPVSHGICPACASEKFGRS